MLRLLLSLMSLGRAISLCLTNDRGLRVDIRSTKKKIRDAKMGNQEIRSDVLVKPGKLENGKPGSILKKAPVHVHT